MRVENVASELDVDPASVYYWMKGTCQPSIQRAYAIIDLAKRFGTKLRLEDIYIRKANTNYDEEKHDGVLSKPASEARDRRLVSATK
jgi:DNA-binding XRE family transcriptional regulator